MRTLNSIRADVLALDAQDQPVLLVEVRARSPLDEALRQRLSEILQEAPMPYAMLVNRQTMQLFRWDGEKLSEPMFQAPTASALAFYDSDFERKEIFDYYLGGLVRDWLDDIAYHWNSEKPPYYDELARIGLAECIRDGSTQTEVDWPDKIVA